MSQALKLPPKPESVTRRTPHRHIDTTLGELIAAAFDAVGSEAKDVAQFLASPGLRRSLKRRIVLV
jgi:hypothetical protein